MSCLVQCSLSVSTSAASQLKALKLLFLSPEYTSRGEVQLVYVLGCCLSWNHPLQVCKVPLLL